MEATKGGRGEKRQAELEGVTSAEHSCIRIITFCTQAKKGALRHSVSPFLSSSSSTKVDSKSCLADWICRYVIPNKKYTSKDGISELYKRLTSTVDTVLLSVVHILSRLETDLMTTLRHCENKRRGGLVLLNRIFVCTPLHLLLQY